ncbi:methyltransferase [Thiorhodococcus drewsii AZ1]|uniref:Ribosomal RNA small subunit methyltransferase D n=1 Tax=Thiorhodococcus drewsii AZ1 TaxID=765913 RepID=G2DVE9_9GAMM|nr:16S rRNA (guanine(966)-N(2))-methyltransferase RsmD [Thiorhodococcus drewsii]EGV33964.1 methyltransferase [Thiorhodococcus drewsii AZ1]
MPASVKTNQLRIIGGRHRGRRLPFPDQLGLRPTSDRVRETLFNWVAPIIEGARCLDVFSGSGALGFEAASRGAGEVVMLERAPKVVHQLRCNAETLALEAVSVHQADSLEWLEGSGRPFDLVFLDPPFADDLLESACARLAGNGWLAPGSRVYLESAAKPGFPDLPADWDLVREKTAGQVRYGLAIVADRG